MLYILTGTLGFLIIRAFDIVSLKKIPYIKPFTWIAGSGLVVSSIIMLCLKSDTLPLPNWSVWLGWGLLSISLLLLIYSLFINLPFRKTYLDSGVSDKVVTSGLYALVRHPWLHWFSLILISLVLVSHSSQLLLAAPVWILLNILLVAIEDRFLFGRMFANYEGYRKQTPMLIPNRQSINVFINSIKSSKSKS